MEDVYDDYLQAFVDYAGGLRVGDPMNPATDVGPMVSAVQPQTERVGIERDGAVEIGDRQVDGTESGGRGEPPRRRDVV